MNNQKLMEERKAELEGMIIQVLGKNLILSLGDILNRLGRVSRFREKSRKEEPVSFNREMVAIVLDEMVKRTKLFKSEDGRFTSVDHYRSLCHNFDGDKRCLCCGGSEERRGELRYCPTCEVFKPVSSIVVKAS